MLDLIAVKKLIDKSFVIPDYQRGYRWTNVEVKALLDDLYTFFTDNPDTDSFYCLQPLVVTLKSKDTDQEQTEFYVVDGQQRLTTMYMLLKYLGIPMKNLLYETRVETGDFLARIDEKIAAEAEEKIDYYYLFYAYKCIKDYFKNDGAEETKKKTFQKAIKDKVKFIWYDFTEEDCEPEQKFAEINTGKIPLTDAELLKAFFLNLLSDENKKSKMVREWDGIEERLQDDEFWAFLYGEPDNKYDTRIEFVFDAVLRKALPKDGRHDTFNGISEIIKKAISNNNTASKEIEAEWKKVKNQMDVFTGWYNDFELFHLLGFLRYKKYNMPDILKMFDEAKNVTDFKNKLHIKIGEIVFKNKDIDNYIDGLRYGGSQVTEVLLLFNVCSILKNKKTNVRFSFRDYYGQKWNIEHVNSRTPLDLSKDGDRNQWIMGNIMYFSGIDLSDKNDNRYYQNSELNKEHVREAIKSIENEDVFLPKKYTKDNERDLKTKTLCLNLLDLLVESTQSLKDSEIYKNLETYFNQKDFNDDDKNKIGNLVLLDEKTNKGYKNSIFPIKRIWIYRAEYEKGIYILPCTRNVFTKNYSSKIYDVMNWTIEDANEYTKQIKDIIKKFLNETLER